MRIGVYIDGFNLYYGGRRLCGRGTAGWRWLDLRALAASVADSRWGPSDVSIMRVVYCTARATGQGDDRSRLDQEAYLHALSSAGSADLIEYGNFVHRWKASNAAVQARNRRPRLLNAASAVGIDHPALITRGDELLVGHEHVEEKGSDVNVASHLLIDVLTEVIDAAVVVTNDSDLALPVRFARTKVPVGLLNPRGVQTAGALRGQPDDGVGSHWWGRLAADDFLAHQMPDEVGRVHRPAGW